MVIFRFSILALLQHTAWTSSTQEESCAVTLERNGERPNPGSVLLQRSNRSFPSVPSIFGDLDESAFASPEEQEAQSKRESKSRSRRISASKKKTKAALRKSKATSVKTSTSASSKANGKVHQDKSKVTSLSKSKRASTSTGTSGASKMHSHATGSKDQTSTGNRMSSHSHLKKGNTLSRSKVISNAPNARVHAEQDKGKDTSRSKDGRVSKINGKFGAWGASKAAKLQGGAHHNQSKSQGRVSDGASAPLNSKGYQEIAALCCNFEMEEFIRRVAHENDLQVCNEEGLQGIVPFHVCEEVQNYTNLLSEMQEAGEGICPWLGPRDTPCRKISSACGGPVDPLSHRRRNCGRADHSKMLNLDMQKAATNESMDSTCGTHQQYVDMAGHKTEKIGRCGYSGDIRNNFTAVRACLNHCCVTQDCIGVSLSSSHAFLLKSFENAVPEVGAMALVHKQR